MLAISVYITMMFLIYMYRHHSKKTDDEFDNNIVVVNSDPKQQHLKLKSGDTPQKVDDSKTTDEILKEVGLMGTDSETYNEIKQALKVEEKQQMARKKLKIAEVEKAVAIYKKNLSKSLKIR